MCVSIYKYVCVSVYVCGGQVVRRQMLSPLPRPAPPLALVVQPDLSSGDTCLAFPRTALIQMIYPPAPLVPFIFPTHIASYSV